MTNFCKQRKLTVYNSTSSSGTGIPSGVVPVELGGTEKTSLTSNTFLVGNNQNPVLTNKNVPSGDVIGSTDTQIMTNKTLVSTSNDIAANSLYSSTGIIDITGNTPTSGQVLTATSPTTAIWTAGGGGGGGGIYGSNRVSDEDNVATTTTLLMGISAGSVIGGSSKLNINSSFSAGGYVLQWSYNWTTVSNSRDLVVVILLDGNAESDIVFSKRTRVQSTTTGLDTDDFAITGSGTNQKLQSSGFVFLDFPAVASHSIELRFGRSFSGIGTDPVSLANARMEIFRVF